MVIDDKDGERTWGEYRRLVINELERLNNEIGKLQQRINGINSADFSKMKADIARLEMEIIREPKRSLPTGILGHLSDILGITPGMLWLTAVLCALLVGKPFIDFLTGLVPLIG